MRSDWVRVTREHRCPICGKPDWCTVGLRGVCCMRVESSKTMRNGGWFHSTNSALPILPMRPARRIPKISHADALIARWRASTTQTHISSLSDALGVTTGALDALGAVWSYTREAWAFPMRDGHGKVVGIRLRSPDRKWAVQGSSEGLFYSPDSFSPGTALVCEGPTDCAAALSMGFNSVGRSSCSCGLDHILALFARTGIMRAIIVSDDDMPGRIGAIRLVEALPIPSKILSLPVKDLRDFVRSGATRSLLMDMLRKQEWNNPKDYNIGARA